MNLTRKTTAFLTYIIMTAGLMSCTESEEPLPDENLIKITEGYAPGAATRVEILAFEPVTTGYNPLVVRLYDSITGTIQKRAEVRLQPLMDMGTMQHSAPAENPAPEAEDGMFAAALMPTMPSGEMGTWTLEISLQNPENGRTGKAVLPFTVVPSAPSRIVSFTAENERRYYVSAHFPQGIKTGVNPIEIIAFTAQAGVFVPLEELLIQVTPEMPSMDHGSPNNENPVHESAGHYSGKVNFTMTGDWRLHLDITDGDTTISDQYFDVVVK